MPTPLFQRLRDCADLHAAMECVLAECLKLSGAERGNIQLLDEHGEHLRIEAQCGFDTDFLTFFARVSIADDSACGQAMLLRKPIIIEDIATDPSYANARDAGLRAGYRAVASIPITHQNLFLGVQSVHFALPEQIARLPTEDLKEVARAAAITIITRRWEERVAARLARTNAAIRRSQERVALSHRILRP